METPVTSPWRKSSWSNGGSGGCVEVARTPGTVLIRDTTNRAAGHIDLTPEAWIDFLTALK